MTDTCHVCGADVEHSAEIDDPERGDSYIVAFCAEHVDLADTDDGDETMTDAGARSSDRDPQGSESEWWPSRIGRLVLTGDLAKVYASYHDPLTGEEYHAGREQGGQRRGWWVQQVVEDTRSGGYRNFDVLDQDAAIRKLHSMASADVGVGSWSDVSIGESEQGGLTAFEQVGEVSG